MKARRVTASTRFGPVGRLTVRDAAELGRFDVAGIIESVEEFLARGIAHWCHDEDRVVILHRTENGEVIH